MPQSLAFEADALSPKRMLSFPGDFSLKEDVELLNPKEAVMNPPPVAPTPTIVQKVCLSYLRYRLQIDQTSIFAVQTRTIYRKKSHLGRPSQTINDSDL